MKKTLSFLSLLTALTIIVISCNNSMSNAGPKEVLVAFFEKMAKKDIEGATQLATKDSKSTMDMMKKAMDASEKMKDAKSTTGEEETTEDFKDVEFGDAKINGDAATVSVKNKKKNTQFDFPLKKEEGAWKVDFSMSTLMKMGMDQMGGEDDTDSSMDNMDPDEFKKSMETADSLLKTVDVEKMKAAAEALKQN